MREGLPVPLPLSLPPSFHPPVISHRTREVMDGLTGDLYFSLCPQPDNTTTTIATTTAITISTIVITILCITTTSHHPTYIITTTTTTTTAVTLRTILIQNNINLLKSKGSWWLHSESRRRC